MPGKKHINPETVARWLELPEGPEKRRFYYDNIMAGVTAMLRDQLLHRQEAGQLERYDNLVCITAFVSFPTIILANAFRPRTLTLFYSPDKEHLLDAEILPRLDSSIQVERIPLDRVNHQDNFDVIKSVVKRNIREGRAVLCDITGGKKVMALQLGIISHQFELDYCYIDAHGYTRSPIPVPGEETLFVHSPSKDQVSEIRYALNPDTMLLIGYGRDTGSINFSLITPEASFRIPPRRLDGEVMEGIAGRMEELFARVNESIGRCEDCGEGIERLSRQVRGNLLPEELKFRLDSLKGQDLRLLLDPEVAGVPWEIALSEAYGIALPVYRMVNREFHYKEREGHARDLDLLLVAGSGEGIPGFERAFSETAASFAGFGNMQTLKAKSRSYLQTRLPEAGARVIVYFGHAVYDDAPEGTGWRCENGDIFPCASLESLQDCPPELIVSNACESARGAMFRAHSFAHSAIRAGCRSYIGTHWFLEVGRSRTFLDAMLEELLVKKQPAAAAFRKAHGRLAETYGEKDVSVFNYVFYGV